MDSWTSAIDVVEPSAPDHLVLLEDNRANLLCMGPVVKEEHDIDLHSSFHQGSPQCEPSQHAHCSPSMSPTMSSTSANLHSELDYRNRLCIFSASSDPVPSKTRSCNFPSNDSAMPVSSETDLKDQEAFSRRKSGYESSSSPDSPDRQYCSSTTQSNSDLIVHSRIEENYKGHDGPKRLCLVCGDSASGFHYGVASCEACKAFFKRTIQGNIEYTCPAANDCEINKRRRKACQACRFQKCLRMGMLKEGVRLDRVRGGRQKYRRNADPTPYPIPSSVSSKKPSLDDNKILTALKACEPLVPTVGSPELPETPSDSIIEILSNLYDREIISVIGWAKQVPGFTDLPLNDQMRLLQSTWTEIITLSLAYRSVSMGARLFFASDLILDEKMAREAGVTELYQSCIYVVERIERLGILKEEFFLLKALVLSNADTKIDDISSVRKLQDSIQSALYDCISVLRPTGAFGHMSSILLCLPILRQSDLAIKKFWLSVKREGKLVMNKLFVEMLEAHFRMP